MCLLCFLFVSCIFSLPLIYLSFLSLQAVSEGQTQHDAVGRPVMHLSALKQATGEAVYCDDVPLYENELYLSLITSSKAHARIM